VMASCGDASEMSLPQAARIVSTMNENDRIRTLVLDRRMVAEPGQFVMVWLPGIDEKPFSLVRDDPVTLMIARVGPFSTAAHSLAPSDSVWIRGPLGKPFHLPDTVPAAGSLLLVGGGYGVAPLRFLAERATASGWTVTVVIGAQTAKEVVYAERFSQLGARVAVTTDDGTAGRQGLATDAAARLLDQERYAAIYACGPEPMLEAVESLALSRHVPAQLSYEAYMRCGMGVCGSCVRQGWLVCRDGPVRHIGVKPAE
jgi:dihydroorotate dehydrogenase electron transfer subunit